MGEQNPRLTCGLSAIDNRFIRGTTAALRSWLLTNVPTPICLCKLFSCKAYGEVVMFLRPSGLKNEDGERFFDLCVRRTMVEGRILCSSDPKDNNTLPYTNMFVF